MFVDLIRRLFARRTEDYANLTAEERIDLARARDDLAASRASERMAGRRFDRELDAEEGRPEH